MCMLVYMYMCMCMCMPNRAVLRAVEHVLWVP